MAATKRTSRRGTRRAVPAKRTKRILAKFRPQAWVRDDAVDVDPEGPTTWDVTNAILAMPRAKALALRDNRENTDALRDLSSAPKWIRKWHGPFVVEVEDSIRDYFGTSANTRTRRSRR